MKYFIDTNVFLRFLEKSNPKLSEECGKFLQKVKEGKKEAYTSTLVLSEVVWVLKSYYSAPKNKIIKSIHAINSMKNLKFVENFNRSIAIKIFSENKVKFIDALISSNPDIQKSGMTVVSYDKDFDKIGVKRVEPGDI